MDYRHLPRILLSIFILAVAPGSARGQNPPEAAVPELTAEQLSDLKKWMSDDAKWEQWYERSGNMVGQSIRQRPEPPAWLAETCTQLIDDAGLLAQACSHLKEISQDFTTTSARRAIAASRKKKEDAKSRFIERVHFGGGWPSVQSGTFSYVGLFESHITIANVGRTELNLPGIIVISMPDGKDGRTVNIGTTLTVGFRLGNFSVPGVKQIFVLHMNVANAWVYTNVNGLGFSNRLSLAGLSVTVKKD